jgi:hypothetical protein
MPIWLRAARITLGQLPPELESVRKIRSGPRDAQRLVDEMELRLDAAGLR